ncbi:hypothetical protein S245_059156, partial [Arachis hypogaea]
TTSQIFLDGCFMRSENYSFFDEYAGPGDKAVCGNKTRTNSSFQAAAKQALLEVVQAAPNSIGYYARRKWKTKIFISNYIPQRNVEHTKRVLKLKPDSVFFHVSEYNNLDLYSLLIGRKVGISTYDYIIALTEQEQEQQGVGGQQSPQMSTVSSLTGFSSARSFTTFQRGSWCTPPRLDEDQFDVIPPESGSISLLGKKKEVSKAAAEARKRSKILKPVVRHNDAFRLEPESSFGSWGQQVPRIDNKRHAASKQGFLPADIAMASMTNVSANNIGKGFSGVSSLAPLQLEPRSAFHMSQAMSSSAANV